LPGSFEEDTLTGRAHLHFKRLEALDKRLLFPQALLAEDIDNVPYIRISGRT
jgi:hypothetical protein